MSAKGGSQSHMHIDHDSDVNAPASEFVTRLHKMLEQNLYPGVIEWMSGGDAFAVKDVGAFVTVVTPRQFKHSNFASFVRQLNKYDFHKIKASDDELGLDGKQAWVFKHPHFRRGDTKVLDHIKRKAVIPTTSRKRKSTNDDFLPSMDSDATGEDLRQEVDALRVLCTTTSTELDSLRDIVQRQQQVLTKVLSALGQPQPTDISSLLASRIPTMDLMNTGLRAQLGGMQTAPSLLEQTQMLDQGSLLASMPPTTQPYWNVAPQMMQGPWSFDGLPLPMDTSPGSANMSPDLLPQQPSVIVDDQEVVPVSMGNLVGAVSPAASSSKTSSAAPAAPTWSVRPRVLLVDDDTVTCMLSGRLLSNLGCAFDVAKDGEDALERMNRAQYDLVLMDIVMPHLDGVAATERIRQFDGHTPIISMTGNSKPADVVNYMTHGMTDILCKPFTRAGLESILDVRRS
ncbi:hypothetical protein BKA62DRAFT_624611 [Auriculariales sp. MPI-PUGE-AT-0066]|nr:hypothetical protein BKA62DRAFT_624611 [Auriculariales sp. MPI-PUGE-AT-0066]